MLPNVVVEILVSRLRELLQLRLRDLSLLVLLELVFRGHFAIEGARIEDLEDHVEKDHHAQECNSSIQEHNCAVEEGPDNKSSDGEELNECDDHDEARDCVLRRNKLRPSRPFLALTKESNKATKEGGDQEWEGKNANVVDSKEDASILIIIDSVTRGASR